MQSEDTELSVPVILRNGCRVVRPMKDFKERSCHSQASLLKAIHPGTHVLKIFCNQSRSN
jgi:hypothetical protein